MEPVIVPRSEHTISRKLIDPDAVKVLYRLHRAGYQAYLVGGGVRDLLVGRVPKDFDISTDAHPHQVKRLFRNCRLIGRRFRLAHVHFGEKILEVSTFRRRSDPVEGETAEDLLIRSDNTFGNAEEDALRRDFTINGLFYDIGTFSLIDYVGGLHDLTERVIRTIGDPDIRFREDPVRMIRAIKFAARLDFTIEPETFNAILRHREEISKSAQPRVLEEIFRLLAGGAAERSFRLLHETGLLEILLPELAGHLEQPDSPSDSHGLWKWLSSLDRMKEEGRGMTNAVLLAVLLGPMAFENPVTDDDNELPLDYEMEDRVRTVLSAIGVPRRDTERIFQIYRAQRRLIGGKGRRFSPRSFLLKNYFPEAFLFLEILSEATGLYKEAVERWRSLAGSSSVPVAGQPERRRRRRRRRRNGSRDQIDGGNGGERPDYDDARPPRDREELAVRQSNGSDDDEDSQIRFLGWSDQPEILKPRSASEPPPPPRAYPRSGARAGSWQGSRGALPEGSARGPGRRQSRGPGDRNGGAHTSGQGSTAPRRPRRGGRRRPRSRDNG